MSDNCDNDILLSEENLEFIDSTCDDDVENCDNGNYFEDIIKKMFITLYKLIKEACMFICKMCYYLFTLIKNKINENNKSLREEIKSQNISNQGNNKMFNKNLLKNKENFISDQDNSGINDILGIDSSALINNNNNNNKPVITCTNRNNTKNKIFNTRDKFPNVKKNNTVTISMIFVVLN